MVNDDGLPGIVLLQSNALVQARVGRILAAHSDLTPVAIVEDVIDMSDALHEGTQLLMVPEMEIDLALQHGQARDGLHVAVLHKEISEHLLHAMERKAAFCHLLGWPDFMTIPQPWDLATAAAMAGGGNQSMDWQKLVPAGSAHRQWSLYSSLDRDGVIDDLRGLMQAHLADERLADTVVEVAYEMAMNAMYDAPVDATGRPKYSHNRQQDIALEDSEVPQLHLASDGTVAVLQIDDPFGRLRREDVLEGIGRGLGARQADRADQILNTAQGGAGLGVFRMYQLATSLIFDVVDGERTRVIAVFDLNLRVRDRRGFPTSLHFSFR